MRAIGKEQIGYLSHRRWWWYHARWWSLLLQKDHPEVVAHMEHYHQCMKLKKANFQREDFQREDRVLFLFRLVAE
jgi:hypothetical protein